MLIGIIIGLLLGAGGVLLAVRLNCRLGEILDRIAECEE